MADLKTLFEEFNKHVDAMNAEAHEDDERVRLVFHHAGEEYILAGMRLIRTDFIGVIPAEREFRMFVLPFFPQIEIRVVGIDERVEDEPTRIGFQVADDVS